MQLFLQLFTWCDFQWKWNTPHASHQNGVVETLIKSVRQSLNATCKNQAFIEEQWRTFLAETTYVINGRPLYPSSDSIWGKPANYSKRYSHRTSPSNSSTRTRRKDQPKTSFKKYRKSRKRILEMLDEILCTKSTSTKYVVSHQRKPSSRRLSSRGKPKSQKIPMEDGACHCNIPRKRWFG